MNWTTAASCFVATARGCWPTEINNNVYSVQVESDIEEEMAELASASDSEPDESAEEVCSRAHSMVHACCATGFRVKILHAEQSSA